MNKELFNMFFREKPISLIIEIEQAKMDTCASNLAKSINCTYSHVGKLLKIMEKSGTIQINKVGRIKLIRLTQKGDLIAKNIIATKELL